MSVKDVVAHVISYEELGLTGLVKRFAKGFLFRANEVGVEEFPSCHRSSCWTTSTSTSILPG